MQSKQGRGVQETPPLLRLFTGLLGRLTIAGVFAVVSLMIFASFSAEFHEQGHLQAFDKGVIQYFRGHQVPVLHSIMKGVSWFAGPIPQAIMLGISVLVFALRRQFWPQAGTLLLAGVGGLGIISGLKLLFHRPRPDIIFAPLGYSFPSGHSFFAVIVYGMTAYWISRQISGARRRRLIWIFAALGILLVGFSRVFLGEHFPSDVGAGFTGALPWAWSCLSLPELLRRHRRRKIARGEITVSSRK